MWFHIHTLQWFRTSICHLMRYFTENSSYFTVGLFQLASPMNIHPLNLGINLTKIDFASPSHLEERSQVLETSRKNYVIFIIM